MSSTPQETRRIQVAVENDVATVTLLDEAVVDPRIIRELSNELYSLVDERGHARIILDFSNVQYIASAALNKLIILQRKVMAAKGRLVLCGLGPAVSEVFVATRLNQKFNIQPDRSAAKMRL